MRRYGSIYKIKNLINNKEYIGQTVSSVEKRFLAHKNEKRNNRHISNAIRSYGEQNFEFIEICSAFSKEDLNELERFFVEHFDTMHPKGYNHRAGGDQNGICSEEMRSKISLSKLGKPNYKRRGEVRTEEQKEKISRTLGGQQIVGVNLITKEIRVYKTAHSTKKDGHNPSNVVQICKKNSYRDKSKGWTFYYMTDYVNQSGSSKNKSLEHAQRLELEPEKTE